MTHHLADIHFPRFKSGIPGYVTCEECGVTVEAKPDPVFPDPWQPLVNEWFRHKGVIPGQGGWQREMAVERRGAA